MLLQLLPCTLNYTEYCHFFCSIQYVLPTPQCPCLSQTTAGFKDHSVYHFNPIALAFLARMRDTEIERTEDRQTDRHIVWTDRQNEKWADMAVAHARGLTQ